jgi:glycerol-3-phosphate dehydrogenase
VREPSSSLNAARRTRELDELASGTTVDVLVLGGGVTGTGVALDAATRGLSVALVEKRDLAHGTSRWSSKLVHGGLRYLAKGQVGIAHESAVERGILMERTAPHLTRALPFVAPVGPGLSTRGALLAGAGFVFGDVLRMAARTSGETLPRPRWIGPDEARRFVPALRREGLRGALLSWDGQLTDDARLVVALARTAAGHGARILTYCRAEKADGSGADVVDERTGQRLRIAARHVVNATGVWADTLAREVRLTPSRGTHLVVSSARLGSPTAALTVPVPGSISRFVFVLPQADGRAYLGLTDEPVPTVEDVPTPTESDRAFLLGVVNRALATALGPDDVIGAFAGLRPLLAGGEGSTADLSRSHEIVEGADGVLTLVGGKLTTYRRMAEDVVDAIAKRPDTRTRRCATRDTPLVGAAPRATLAGMTQSAHLVARYGEEARAVAELASSSPELAAPVVEGLPYLAAELRFAVEHEGALTVEDLLDRRTRIGLVPHDREQAFDVAARFAAAE